MSELVVPGTMVEGFGSTSVAKVTETASVAVAARARASVEARFVMAERHPRDLAEARSRLLADCARPAFAAASWYKIPNRGEGFTIRFAEAAIRAMRNISVDATVVFDDDEMRTLRVEVTDLEANTTYAIDANIRKTIERKKLREGEVALRTRTTSAGGIVHVVTASDDELAIKQAAAVSKALRTQGLRHIPGDILHEAKAAIAATRDGEVRADPRAVLSKLVDAFAPMGVSVAMIRRHLGVAKIEEIDANQIGELRNVYAAMQDGVRWSEAIGEDPDKRPVPAGKGVAGLAAKVTVATAEEAGPTHHGLAARANELMGEAAVSWEEFAFEAAKLNGGVIPDGFADVSRDDMKKLVAWLEVAAEAQRQRDDAEGA